LAQPCPLMFIYPRAKAQDPMILGMVRVLREIWGAAIT
jgi:hypothetical protein